MIAQRMYKEARPLFWPWCAVVCAGALPLLHPPYPLGEISRVGFLLGIPLLAALPFGNEFRSRTFSLLLSQPISRMEIWREKLSITALVVFTASLVFFSSWRASGVHGGRAFWRYAVAAAIVSVASAPFWTLFSRSIVGGLVLSFGVYNFVIVLGLQALYWGSGYSNPPDSIFISTMSAVFLLYAGLMLWLGWRKLARFQAMGDMPGDDLLIAGPRLLPQALAGWLRCRPTGAVLNLFRKEYGLLRPVWLISLATALLWACLILVGPPGHGAAGSLDIAMFAVGVTSSFIIAILAGSLSLGEERTFGIHPCQLILPVPVLVQWGIKLFVAFLATLLGAGLLPPLIHHKWLGSSYGYEYGPWLLGMLLLTFAAFWCACAGNGTVSAVLWVFPVMIALYLAGEFGKWAGPVLTHLFFSRFDPFGNVKFANAVSRLGSNPFFKLIQAASNNATDSVQAAFVLNVTLLVPTVLYAVTQSCRLFRARLQVRALSVVRSLVPLALTVFLCSFFSLAFYTFVGGAAWNPKGGALLETIQAIQKIRSAAPQLNASHPLQLTVEDLAKAFPLSKSTRRLLGNSHITLRLEEPPHHGHFGCAENPEPHGLPALRYSWYSAIVPIADGSHFFIAFDPVTYYTISAGFCK